MWINDTISTRAQKDDQLQAVRAAQSSLSNSTQTVALINFYFPSIAIINKDSDYLYSREQWEHPAVPPNIYH